jgi:hypothetical protein
MHVQVFGIGGGEQFLDGLFERPTIHQLESQHHAEAIEGAHRQGRYCRNARSLIKHPGFAIPSPGERRAGDVGGPDPDA